MLLEDNSLTDCCYDSKKILCPMSLEYIKIHAFPNDCILYKKEYEKLDQCLECRVPRYKLIDNNGDENVSRKTPPAKVLWYLLIISRFKRHFANANDAKNVRWHANEIKCDGNIRHVTNSLQWEKINSLFLDFATKIRNLRLGLSTDGMNPFSNLSTYHSSWPVLLTIYNLSPWLCMKHLRLLWEEGVEVDDAYSGEKFKMRAMLFHTINDFPTYGNLAGYSVKGHKACPIWESDTCYHQLDFGKKTVYLGHQKFLKLSHSYRRLRKAFNGEQEFDIAPKPLTGDEVYQQQKHINVVFGKREKEKWPLEKNIWKKRYVFFDLPYWSSLGVRHCLDMMHVEKNVCDSLIGTLQNILGKNKDSKQSHLDMEAMGIRKQLSPIEKGKQTYLPPAYYTLCKKEKKSFCGCLYGIKVSQGYSSNIKRLVSMKDLKLIGFKSHDCHVLMQQLLPVAICGIQPKNVRVTITKLCLFFNAICSKVLDFKKLDELEDEAAIILCQLEMYFPPSFVDVMVHLIAYLVREIRICGPVYLRWMYLIEQYMKIFEGYTKNHHRPEASIVERYITEEVVEFCTNYLSEAKSIGISKSRHGDTEGRGIQGLNVKSMTQDVVIHAHFYILNNLEEVQPYVATHKRLLKKRYP